MVSLPSNRQKIYYGELTGYTDIVDSDGYKTGEKEKVYSTPLPFLIYVSPAKGENSWNPYGIGDEYSNVMSTNDRTCPIQEDSVLWVGIDPEIDETTGKATVEHNYIVTRRAEGLNSILFAIKRVDVS
jgi:hypothetical protein